MNMHTLEAEQWLPITRQEAWAFFSNPANLGELTPEDFQLKIESGESDRTFEGQILVYRMKALPGLWMRWVTEIKALEEGVAFVDEQRFGPYRFWHHRHSFEETEGGVLMRDRVNYAMPFGPIGAVVHGLFVRRKLEQIFAFRREALKKRFGGS